MKYHVRFVTGTDGQTGHLADRIRILDRPDKGHHALTFGWLLSDTEALDDGQVRALMADHGISYPKDVPILVGDYSISIPEWNSEFYHWKCQPNPDLPVFMQPRWWMAANRDRFPGDPYGESAILRDWLSGKGA